eukprot:COSAG04_NODE_25289_length_309_cov_1.042857_1_plen_61_part_10
MYAAFVEQAGVDPREAVMQQQDHARRGDTWTAGLGAQKGRENAEADGRSLQKMEQATGPEM